MMMRYQSCLVSFHFFVGISFGTPIAQYQSKARQWYGGNQHHANAPNQWPAPNNMPPDPQWQEPPPDSPHWQPPPNGPQWKGQAFENGPFYDSPAQSQQVSNSTAGHYENSARTEHGRRLGRMLDVLGAKYGDIGNALDSIAERFQQLLREAQQNQDQNLQPQNSQPQNSYGAAGYSKRAWSGGYSKKPWSSWSPNAGYSYSKKPWSPWTRASWSPNGGYNQKPWSSWSPSSGNSGFSKKAWSPNAGYSKKPWSSYSRKPWTSNTGYAKRDWGAAGYSKQPWTPANNANRGQRGSAPHAPVDGPGMDVDDFAMVTNTAKAETESRSKRTRKEKTTRETNALVDADHQTESVDAANIVDFGSHETESFTKSAETVDANFNNHPAQDNISVE